MRSLSTFFVPLLLASTACSTKEAPLTVRKTPDGLGYKILQVPDIHFTADPTYPCSGGVANVTACTEAFMEAKLGKMLDDVKPDFVVFSGDQIEAIIHDTTFNAEAQIRAYSKFVIKRKLPWAMIFGNHDENALFNPNQTSKAAQMKLIESLPYSHSRAGPKDVDGVSNYVLNIQKPGSKDAAFRMYFADTGAWGTFTTNQTNYFKSMAKKYRGDNVPAIMFFHIPTVHYANFTKGQGTQGSQGESVTSGIDNAALFDTMVAMGDVKASFVGHDHYNDYCFLEKPIHLCYGGGVGYGAAYGKPEYSRRARVIEWSWTAKKETIETYIYRQTEANDFAKYTIYNRSIKSYQS